MSKTLTVYLAADLKKFNSGLDSAKGSLNSFDRGMSGIGSKLSNMLGPALIGATAAAGAFALKLGVDGVKAAIDDEAASARLAQTLENLGFGYATESVEGFIDATQRQTGIVDDQLRPAFERLLRSTGSIDEAQRALQLSLDISASKGKDLGTVANSLGKAYDGNASALGRLGLGIDSSVLKTGDMVKINQTLSNLFAGQASTAADTYQGRLNRLSVGVDELKESFGTGLLNSLKNAQAGTDDLMSTMEELEPIMQDLGAEIGYWIQDLSTLVGSAQDAKTAFDNWSASLAGPFKFALDGVISATGNMLNPLGALANLLRQVGVWTDSNTSSNSKSTTSTNSNTDAINKNAMSAARNALQRQRALAWQQRQIDADDDENTRKGTLTATVDRLTAAQEKWIAKQEAAAASLTAQSEGLKTYIEDVKAWEKQITDFVSGITQDIVGQFDLTGVFEAAMGAGAEAGSLIVAGTEAEAAKTEWFGNVLAAVQREGSAELRDYLVKVGGENAAAWGQALIDNGLVKWMADKLVDVQAQGKATAESMIPEFMTAGYLGGLKSMEQAMQGVSDSKDDLAKVGKKAGDVLGKNMAASIAKEIADAVKAAEAAGAAARAEAVAQEEARQAAMTRQALAQVVAQAITNSNARAGNATQPVLA